MKDLIVIFLFVGGLLALALVLAYQDRVRDATREAWGWWRRRGRPVALEDTSELKFWRRGMTDSMLARRAAVGRWLRKHNRLRGARLRDQRAVLSVAGERDAQSERDREYLKAKESQ